jgi:5-methylthioadenosine/S-adenosylhomocysteine deaminase
MKQRIDALISPRWVVRVEPMVSVEQGISIAVDRGRILNLLPAAEAMSRYEPDVHHERPEHVLIPGLINAHTHAGMSLMRGFADDMALERWLEERIWPAESRWVTPAFAADGTRLAIAEMLKGGVTCFADMYYFPDVVAETALEAGMRVVVGMIALEFPTVWASTPDEYISKGLAVHDRYRSDPLVTTAFAPHAPYSVSDRSFERVRQLADELEVPIHMHVHETADEVRKAEAQTGERPLARLDRLGLVTPALMAVHATQLIDAEIELLARAGASVIHCPRSNMKLASGACPVAALSAAGVNVAVGTDGAASNNRLDVLAELQQAALLAKLVAGDPATLPAREAVKMATINAARALGLAQETGSLTAGKAADLACVRLAGPASVPVLDPLSELVYCASREQVSDVWVAGEHLLADGTLTRMDEQDICARAESWGRRLTSA